MRQEDSCSAPQICTGALAGGCSGRPRGIRWHRTNSQPAFSCTCKGFRHRRAAEDTETTDARRRVRSNRHRSVRQQMANTWRLVFVCSGVCGGGGTMCEPHRPLQGPQPGRSLLMQGREAQAFISLCPWFGLRVAGWTQLPLMRTTALPCSCAFRSPRSPGATGARPSPPGSLAVTAPRAGTKRIPPFTDRPWRGSTRAASGGHGAPLASSPPSTASNGIMDGGLPRRTSLRTTAFRATQPCGAYSAASERRLNSLRG